MLGTRPRVIVADTGHIVSESVCSYVHNARKSLCSAGISGRIKVVINSSDFAALFGSGSPSPIWLYGLTFEIGQDAPLSPNYTAMADGLY